MRSVISRRLGKGVYAAAKSVIGENGGYWREMRTRGLVGGGGDENQKQGKMMGAIRIWEQQKRKYSMKHQEIEGATVERDMSGVAKEAREVTESMMKTMYGLSKAVAALGILQLGIGAYMSSSSSNCVNMLNMSISAVAFGFPFSMALLMRQSLKAMHFFHKMEQIGRLQLLTSTMQVSKHLRLFFLRLRLITYTSLSGLFLSFLYSLFSPLFTTSTTTTT